MRLSQSDLTRKLAPRQLARSYTGVQQDPEPFLQVVEFHKGAIALSYSRITLVIFAKFAIARRFQNPYREPALQFLDSGCVV